MIGLFLPLPSIATTLMSLERRHIISKASTSNKYTFNASLAPHPIGCPLSTVIAPKFIIPVHLLRTRRSLVLVSIGRGFTKSDRERERDTPKRCAQSHWRWCLQLHRISFSIFRDSFQSDTQQKERERQYCELRFKWWRTAVLYGNQQERRLPSLFCLYWPPTTASTDKCIKAGGAAR